MELSNIASVRYQEQINASCLNMQQLCGIDYFVIYLLFKNKDVFVLSNIYSHLSDYYEHQFFTHDHSTSINLFKDNYYLCQSHLGISEQYQKILADKHQVHRAYYQIFPNEDFDIVLGAASSTPIENLNQIYSKTKNDFNQFIISFVQANLNIFKKHNPELKLSPFFNQHDIRKLFAHTQRTNKLAPREITCLQLTAKGFTADKISKILNISKYTVDQYKKNILTKLNAANMPNAVYLAMKQGLLSQDHIIDLSSDVSLEHFRNIS